MRAVSLETARAAFFAISVMPIRKGCRPFRFWIAIGDQGCLEPIDARYRLLSHSNERVNSMKFSTARVLYAAVLKARHTV